MSHSAPHWILHLGMGAFHRAHEAWYLNRLMALDDNRWALASGNIRPDLNPLLAALERQGGRYTLETVTPEGQFAYEQIRAIRQVLPWSPDLRALVTMGRDAATRIISFTVTEAGYYLDAHQQLDLSVADLRSDVEDGTMRTIYGTICSILRARHADNAGAVTLLCCDNIRSNGDHFRAGLRHFLRLRNELALLAWVETNTSCPNAMVDRITPRVPAETAARVKAATGIDDDCAVMAEDFCQWVIEDHFCHGRPAWEQVGVEMVGSVLPYEEAKIRILNASHSCIAWAGAMAGLQFIDEATSDPVIRQLAWNYVTDDVIPCLSPSPVDLPRYRDTVLERFSNPFIKDTIGRVAADGFSKIPGFIAPTIAERIASGSSFASTAVLPALFLHFLRTRAAGKLAFVYQDQALDEAQVALILAAPDVVQAFCANTMLWGALAGNAILEDGIRRAYVRLDQTTKES